MLRAFQRHTGKFLSASQGTRPASEDAEEESETDSEEAGRDSETEPLVEEAGQGGGELEAEQCHQLKDVYLPLTVNIKSTTININHMGVAKTRSRSRSRSRS